MSISSTSRKRIPLDVRVAYPGILGPGIPDPPEDYVPYGQGYTARNRAGFNIEWSALLTAWVNPVTGVPV